MENSSVSHKMSPDAPSEPNIDLHGLGYDAV